MKVQGFILIDVNVAALNNAGSIQVAGTENRVVTKKIVKNGRAHTYVSGQAWRYWWRETLQKYFKWSMSPITREEKVAYTDANPIRYDDDDIFGYMRAAKEVVLDENGNELKDKKGKPKMVNATVTRVSPLKNSALVSVGNVRVATHFASLSRHAGNPVPYGKEEYGAIMKGMFSLDLDQVGTFSSYNKTGFKNLNTAKQKEALDNPKNFQINDEFVKDKEGNPAQLVRLSPDVRKKRAVDALKALTVISGGAMQTNNMEDVTPKFIVLANTTTGNHPFSHIITADHITKEDSILSIEAIKEVLKEYKKQFVGTIYIGRRTGFFDAYKAELDTLTTLDEKEYPKVEVGAVNEMIDKFSKIVGTYIESQKKPKDS